VAEPEAHEQLRFRCPACGSPRIPLAAEQPASSETMAHLKAARGASSSQLAWKAAAGVSAGFGVLGLLIMTGVFAIVSPPLIPIIASYLLASSPLLFAAIGFKNASKRSGQVSGELQQAWLIAARDIARSKGIMRASDLTSVMRIDEKQAEQLMMQLAAFDEIRPDVTEAGDLAVSIRGARMRVATPENEPRPEAASEPAEQEAGDEPQGRGKAGA
jgi:hypothetical protein